MLSSKHMLYCAFFLFCLTAHASLKEPEDTDKNKRLDKTQVKDAKLLDINNIDCWVQNDGAIGESPQTGGDGFYFPDGQRTLSIIYTSGMWVIGWVNGECRSAVNSYGSEFQPGMILEDGKPDSVDLDKYIVHKYETGDLIAAEAIRQGCPDSLLGDQMLYCVYNDLKSHQGMWGGKPMGIEVQQTVFGFRQDTPVGNMVFVKWRVINKSSQSIDSAFVSFFFDPDLGQANDDYTGCDTSLELVFVYNGDSYDDKYGAQVPAMGCDLLQGVIVDAVGDTASLPDGSVIPDKRVLGPYAAFFYIGGSPIAGMHDPHTPEQGYNYSSGFRGNGYQWSDLTPGVEPTRFPFAGDPVTDTGWLFSDITPPKDIRMGISTGPFDLAPGESQEVIYGLIVGLGGDNLNSITVMREYDIIAKNIYDLNMDFGTPPPQPIVNVAELDHELVLTWDGAARDFTKAGYEFEGYNVYQGETPDGPWHRLATFDKKNGITSIYDRYYDIAVDGFVEKIIQHGSDSGLAYSLHLSGDQIKKERLINGKPYYYAVTGYMYDPDGLPKVIENAKETITVVPRRPVLDMAYQSVIGETLSTTLLNGIGSKEILPTVIDPTAIIPAYYKVNFDPDSTWSLWRDDDLVFGGQTNSRMDEDYLIVDGIQVKVGEFTFEPPIDYSDISYRHCSGIFDYTSFHDHHWAETARAVDSWGHGTDDPELLRGDIELRWTGTFDPPVQMGGETVRPVTEGRGSLVTFVGAENYDIADHPLNPTGTDDYFTVRVPFEVWDIERDMQINAFIYDAEKTLGSGNDFYAFNPFDRMHIWINALPYQETVLDPDNQYSDDGDYNTWNLVSWHSEHELGDVLRVNYLNPVIGGVDEVAFSTHGYEPIQTAETAKSRLDDINVFPNPYFAWNKRETGWFEQFVTFNNLPGEDCTIRVFSLSGQLVRTLGHDNGTPFQRWDLRNEHDLPVGSGMYIIHIQTKYGDRILKLGFINREAVYDHL